MKRIKTRGYADRTREITVHIYGFADSESQQALSEEIRRAIQKYRRKNREKNFEYKIALD